MAFACEHISRQHEIFPDEDILSRDFSEYVEGNYWKWQRQYITSRWRILTRNLITLYIHTHGKLTND